MADYWLDSNSLIEPNKGPYGFDIAPGFWKLVDQQASAGVVSSPMSVYDELVSDFEDELADWAKEQKSKGLFVEPDEAVQQSLRAIADYVLENYDASNAQRFLGGQIPGSLRMLGPRAAR